ncbi:MAG: hypothetical protein QOE97_1585 [Pseudonocardiales bacterium]|nr:hypothetical protein [Pseudonocardiales bacterium]
MNDTVDALPLDPSTRDVSCMDSDETPRTRNLRIRWLVLVASLIAIAALIAIGGMAAASAGGGCGGG